VFDWTAGGHRPTYVRRLVEALHGSVGLLLALPDATLAEIGDLGVATVSLGDARPPLGGQLRRGHVIAEELERLRGVASGADRTLHLFGDHVLFRLATTKRLPGKISLVLYYPRWHYGDAFGTRLPLVDRAVALAKELALQRWRRRPDAGAVFALDEELAQRWSRRPGAPACWLPEPPVAQLPNKTQMSEKRGCIIYGALAPRKGIGALASALTIERTEVTVVIAGAPEPTYLSQLHRHVDAMRAAGVDVDLRARRHSEQEGLAALADARCAVLPYPRHPGMSRVLLEACSVGTPVVADDFGLVGHLVRRHQLGVTVDCTDRRALRSAIKALLDPETAASHSHALERFAERFTPSRFRAALLRGLAIPDVEV